MPKVPATFRVFKLEPAVWWAGMTMAACVNEAKAQDPTAAADPEEYDEILPAELEGLTYTDVLGSRTFAQRLEEVKSEPGFDQSPRLFYRTPEEEPAEG